MTTWARAQASRSPAVTRKAGDRPCPSQTRWILPVSPRESVRVPGGSGGHATRVTSGTGVAEGAVACLSWVRAAMLLGFDGGPVRVDGDADGQVGAVHPQPLDRLLLIVVPARAGVAAARGLPGAGVDVLGRPGVGSTLQGSARRRTAGAEVAWCRRVRAARRAPGKSSDSPPVPRLSGSSATAPEAVDRPARAGLLRASLPDFPWPPTGTAERLVLTLGRLTSAP